MSVSKRDYPPVKTFYVLKIPQSDVIFLNFRNKRIFPDAEVFRPERWLGEEKSKIHPMAVRQFGKGPRMCIGIY